MTTPLLPQHETNRKPQKRKGGYYAQIHRNPLPLEVFPLPLLHPTQPLSLLHLVWTYLRQLISPPSSIPTQKYLGCLSADSRSIHVTDPQHVRALWEQGFFGKGSLSRSEPTWMDRETTRLAAKREGFMTAEEATKARRDERRLFKLERARLERERIESQRKLEQGLLDRQSTFDPAEQAIPVVELLSPVADEHEQAASLNALLHTTSGPDGKQEAGIRPSATLPPARTTEIDIDTPMVDKQEHLQLTFEEAFFLSFGLGVLNVTTSDDVILTNAQLFKTFQQRSQSEDRQQPAMDNQFLLNYVVYHHFRSLGWVVRSGVKFSADYLLYNRGPVFSHAEFAVLIMPSYSDPYWQTDEGASRRKLSDQKDWWWLHCINRVQSQVKKTLVLCYVDIPPPDAGLMERDDVRAFLKQYRVQEFTVRRWLMNRSRD